MGMDTSMSQHTCGVLGVELRLSGLVASTLTGCGISPAFVLFFRVQLLQANRSRSDTCFDLRGRKGTALGIQGLDCYQVSVAPCLIVALLFIVCTPFPPCGIPTSCPLDLRTEQRQECVTAVKWLLFLEPVGLAHRHTQHSTSTTPKTNTKELSDLLSPVRKLWQRPCPSRSVLLHSLPLPKEAANEFLSHI